MLITSDFVGDDWYKWLPRKCPYICAICLALQMVAVVMKVQIGSKIPRSPVQVPVKNSFSTNRCGQGQVHAMITKARPVATKGSDKVSITACGRSRWRYLMAP